MSVKSVHEKQLHDRKSETGYPSTASISKQAAQDFEVQDEVQIAQQQQNRRQVAKMAKTRLADTNESPGES